jgi:hypothetical protein
MTEAQEQQRVVDYIHKTLPDVLLTCTGAGLGFHARHQKKMNTLGYLRGTPDLLVFEPRGAFHGLMIEMKSATGDVKPHQKEIMDKLRARGYRAHVCFGADQAIQIVNDYFSTDLLSLK